MLHRLLVMTLALILAGCASLPPGVLLPRVSVATLDISSLGLFEQHFDVGLRLANQNDFDVTVDALDFELEVNGRSFAKGQSRTPTRIPASSSVVVQVDGVTRSKDLVSQFLALSPEALKEGLPYRISGRVKTDKSFGWLTFEQKGVYGGERPKTPGVAI